MRPVLIRTPGSLQASQHEVHKASFVRLGPKSRSFHDVPETGAGSPPSNAGHHKCEPNSKPETLNARASLALK